MSLHQGNIASLGAFRTSVLPAFQFGPMGPTFANGGNTPLALSLVHGAPTPMNQSPFLNFPFLTKLGFTFLSTAENSWIWRRGNMQSAPKATKILAQQDAWQDAVSAAQQDHEIHDGFWSQMTPDQQAIEMHRAIIGHLPDLFECSSVVVDKWRNAVLLRYPNISKDDVDSAAEREFVRREGSIGNDVPREGQLSFEIFVHSRNLVTNIAEALEVADEGLQVPGYVYPGACFIEKLEDQFVLTISSESYIDPSLSRLEQILYEDWYCPEA